MDDIEDKRNPMQQIKEDYASENEVNQQEDVESLFGGLYMCPECNRVYDGNAQCMCFIDVWRN